MKTPETGKAPPSKCRPERPGPQSHCKNRSGPAEKSQKSQAAPHSPEGRFPDSGGPRECSPNHAIARKSAKGRAGP